MNKSSEINLLLNICLEQYNDITNYYYFVNNCQLEIKWPNRCIIARSIILQLLQIKLRPCENSLADFCSFVLPKVLKINLLYSNKANSQAFRSVEVKISAQKFSHGLDLRMNGCLHFIFSLWQGCRKWGNRGEYVPPPDFCRTVHPSPLLICT